MAFSPSTDAHGRLVIFFFPCFCVLVVVRKKSVCDVTVHERGPQLRS